MNLFNANKRLHDLQSDMEQLKLSVTKIESDFDAQSKHLNGKITELSSALDAAYVLLQHYSSTYQSTYILKSRKSSWKENKAQMVQSRWY